jgi:hypothetical protein
MNMDVNLNMDIHSILDDVLRLYLKLPRQFACADRTRFKKNIYNLQIIEV